MILFFPVLLHAVPATLTGDEEGWLEFSLGYSLTLPTIQNPEFGHSIRGGMIINPGGGFGCGIGMAGGETFTSFYLEGHYYISFDAFETLSFPLYIKLGLLGYDYESWLGLFVESGCKFFFNETVEIVPQSGPQEEYSWLSAELLGELAIPLFPIFESSRIDGDGEAAYPLLISTSLLAGLDFTPQPSSNTYYTY